jgi:hypothetical protein
LYFVQFSGVLTRSFVKLSVSLCVFRAPLHCALGYCTRWVGAGGSFGCTERSLVYMPGTQAEAWALCRSECLCGSCGRRCGSAQNGDEQREHAPGAGWLLPGCLACSTGVPLRAGGVAAAATTADEAAASIGGRCNDQPGDHAGAHKSRGRKCSATYSDCPRNRAKDGAASWVRLSVRWETGR